MLDKIEILSSGAGAAFMQAPGEDPLPAVLLVHGWRSDVSSTTYQRVVERLNKAKYHCLSLALRGHEGSPGNINLVTRENHIKDINAALQYLKARRDVDSSHISAVGGSYGAYLLAVVAPEANFDLLVLRAPALYPDVGWSDPTSAIADNPDVEWRKLLHGREDSMALNGLARFKGKTLLIASEKDEYIPPTVIESYLESAYSGLATQRTIKGAGHVLRGETREEYFNIVEQWFTENYPRASS